MTKHSFSKLRSYLWQFNHIVDRLKRNVACTPRSLADELEIDPRTVRRHIHALKELGAPIHYNRTEQCYQLSDPCWTMPNFYLKTQELEAMALSVRLLGPVVPEPFGQPMKVLFAKLLDALPADQRDDILRTSSQVTFAPVPVRSKGDDHVQPLWLAIREQVRVTMRYYVASQDRETQRTFDPYHLRYFWGCWYVVGYDHLTGHWPVFSLARIRELTITQEPYVTKAFDAGRYFENSFGIVVGGTPKPVRIRLIGWAARTAAEKHWPAGFTCQPDGPDAVIITGKLSNHGDLLPWIAMHQGEAEILPTET